MNYFSLFPADMLHTVHGGVVRYTVVWALDVVKVSMQWCCSIAALRHVIPRIKHSVSCFDVATFAILWYPQMTKGTAAVAVLDKLLRQHNTGSSIDADFEFIVPCKVC